MAGEQHGGSAAQPWSGTRKRLTAVAVLVLAGGIAFTAHTVWRKATWEPVTATVLNARRDVTLTPQRTVTYQATLRYDAAGRSHTQTTAYRASWLEFERGEQVPLLLQPGNVSHFVFDTFVPTWGFSLLILGAGGFAFWVARGL